MGFGIAIIICKIMMEGKTMKKEKDDEKIACHVCQKMIPKAAAIHAEGKEYVLHFCNIDCLDYWKAQEKKKKESNTQDK